MTRKTPKMAATDYEVGRRKPPKASRFKPGQSGNPGGRKKGSLNFKTMLLDVLEAEMEITEKGRARRVPTVQALMLSQVQEGLRGKLGAIDSMLDRYERYANADAAQANELPEDDEALLQRVLAAYAGQKPPLPRNPRACRSRPMMTRVTRMRSMMMADRARLLRMFLRQNLSVFSQKVFGTLEPGTPYLHNWHIDHLCWQLMRVARGKVRRLIINVPPRSMKSITVSVGFSAWVMGLDPTKRIICVSYADDLARKLSVDTRTVLDSPWYRAVFPKLQLVSKRPRNMELITTEQGYRFATGINGSILGRGADLIVVDDPIKATDAMSEKERRRVNEAFDNTLQTRLNDKRSGAIVIIMQRLHEDDLVGHVVGREDWEVVSIPAIETDATTYQLSDRPGHVYVRQPGEALHEAREPRVILEQMRRAQGSLTFSAQYQQAPIPPEGNIVRREWLRTYGAPPKSFDVTLPAGTPPRLCWKARITPSAPFGARRGSTSICLIWCASVLKCRS